MALQSSGTISLSQVQGEFGGSNPISISEYYGAATGVPGSGRISLSDFYGKSNYIKLQQVGSAIVRGSAGSIAVPSGTKSIIVTAGCASNRGRNARITACTISGSRFAEVGSINDGLGEYLMDSAIFALNYSSTGSKYISLSFTTSPPYGAQMQVIFLNKAFNSYSASSIRSRSALSNPLDLTGMTTYGEGFQIGTSMVRSDQNPKIGSLSSFTFKGTTSISFNQFFPNSLIANPGAGGRVMSTGWLITGGLYNVASTQQTFRSFGIWRDYGESFIAATWAPTRFV